ncbi:amidohydrolase family protein [Herbiconiux sp.]|uniref:amidohydrolase family protein n=1 Tax=Herbiconiux sp. TaxID=1871186 RepID=UPI0025BA0B16|nr:amidohydrolase family protein [Herbiconiux sp.]
MSTLWQNALLIAQDDEHGSTPFRADVRIDGDRITAVDAPYAPTSALAGDADAPRSIVDATHLLITPGLVNAHTHSWEILVRGTSDPLPLEIWTLLSYPPTGVEPLPERLIYLRTMVAAIESLLGGTTALLDDVGELPDQSPSTIAQVYAAYDAAGIRATCTGVGIDVPIVDRLPFADEVLPAEILRASRESMPPSADVQDAYFGFCAAARALTTGRPRLRFAVAPSAPQRVTDELLVRAAAEARAEGEVLHLHLLETRAQQTLARTRYAGRTIVEHLDELGVLGPNVTLAHGIWLTAGDLELIAASGATVVHNPLSNLKLGSGVLGWRALHDAGVRVALGTDGASSNDTMRMLDVVKATAGLHTLTDPDYRTWPTVDEVLHAATVAGARAAGWGDEVGSIAPGRKADLVLYDLTAGTAFTPLNDAAQQLVFAENGSSIHQVWVDGRLVVEDGRCTRIDADALLAEFREAAGVYLAEALPRWRAFQSEMEPFVREAYLRATASEGHENEEDHR